MTRPDIDAINARAAAATEGPWRHGLDNRPGEEVIAEFGVGFYLFSTATPDTDPAEDATFIAASRTDVPALTAYVKELEAERDRYREALVRAREDMVAWSGYASEYFQEKWGLPDDLAAIDAALHPEQGAPQ